VPILDVISLASLYTLRIIAGGFRHRGARPRPGSSPSRCFSFSAWRW
jgi:hypothetical protein